MAPLAGSTRLRITVHSVVTHLPPLARPLRWSAGASPSALHRRWARVSRLFAARADEADQVFDPSGVALIDLTLSEAAQDALAADPGEYVDATLSLKFGDLG